MRWIARIRYLLRSLFDQSGLDAELDEEMRGHLERQTEYEAARGLAPRSSAIGLEARKDECRDARGVAVIDNIGRDVRFAVRQLRRNPIFAATAIVTLALGFTCALAILAYVNAALIQPLPYASPATLAAITESKPGLQPEADLSFLDYLDWKSGNSTLASLDVHSGGGYLLDTPSGGEPIRAGRVSDGFFRTLGVQPALGRDFLPGEDAAPPHSVLLSHATWMRRFGGRADIAGQKLILSGQAHQIVGVLPAGFHFAPRGNPEIWVTLDRTQPCLRRRSCHNLHGVGRLKDGVSMEAARAELNALAARLEQQYPEDNKGRRASVEPLTGHILGRIRPMLAVLMAGAAMLLTIAVVNVLSLLLVRSETRRRELSIRGTLGATKGRLWSQFAIEAILLVGAGTVVGAGLSMWAASLLGSLIPPALLRGLPFLEQASAGTRELAWAVGVSAVIAMLYSSIPALYLRWSGGNALAEGSRGSAGRGWHRLGRKLVVAECACAIILLSAAALLAKSLYQLLNVEMGFEPGNLALVSVSPPDRYGNQEPLSRLSHEIMERVGRLPGVEAVSVAGTLPATVNGNTTWLRIAGRPYDGSYLDVNYREVADSHLRVTGAKLLRGRFFNAQDRAGAPRVCVINESFARRYFPGEDPVGQRLGDPKLSPGSLTEIVGVIADIREGPLDSQVTPAEYVPFDQDADMFFSVLVRTKTPPEKLLPLLTPTIKSIDRGIALIDLETMADHISQSPAAYLHRSTAWLTGGFALMALVLSVVGLYGVVAYSVGQRTRELGVRMALGAAPAAVCRLILRESGMLVAAAAVLGMAGASISMRVIKGRFFGVESLDPALVAGAAGVLAACTLLASLAPARKAAKVNPVQALRCE